MKARQRYTVTYERDEKGWWVTEVRELPGCSTQGRTIEQARDRTREALSLFIGSAAEKVDLVSNVILSASLRQKIDLANDARRRADAEAQKASSLSRLAAKLLAADGLSARDTGELLGVTRQRAHQLLTG